MHCYLRAGESGGKPNRFINEKTTVGRLPEDSVMYKGIIKDRFSTLWINSEKILKKYIMYMANDNYDS